MPEVKLPTGDFVFHLGTQEEANKLQGVVNQRHAITLQICKEKGWCCDIDKLSMEQIIEIRKDSRWKGAE